MPEPDTTPAASLCHCGLGTREGCATEPWGCGPASTDPGTTDRTETGATITDPQVGGGGAGDNGPDGPYQVWPLARVLRDVAVGSGDWSWEEEWADLDKRHQATGYLTKLEQQIRENGITMPVLIGSDGRLWDGHHRLRLAVKLGIGYIPVEITPPAPGGQTEGAQS